MSTSAPSIRAGVLACVLALGPPGLMPAPLRAQDVASEVPSIALLAGEIGRASRRQPIGAVAREPLCDPAHPAVDSASAQACAVLGPEATYAFVQAFVVGLRDRADEPLTVDSAPEPPVCQGDLERNVEGRFLLARLTAPVVGQREGLWEARVTVEVSCRAARPEGQWLLRAAAKEYLYQWDGRGWRLYQFAWRRTRG